MKKGAAILDIQIDLDGWRRVRGLRPRVQAAAQAVATLTPRKHPFPFTATLLLTGNARVRRLNRDFRGIDAPTNVLSFPQYTLVELALLAPKNSARATPPSLTLPARGRGKSGTHAAPIELGDIAIAYQYTAAEAKREKKLLIDHITHLVIHGLLHNLGFDHMNDRDATRMEKLEQKIMMAMGLPDPYAAPSDAR